MLKLLFSASLSFSILFSFSQTLTYEIILFGKVIGTTTVKRTVTQGGYTHFLLQSSSISKILFVTRRTSQNYLVTYHNNQLVSVDATNNLDGEITEVKVNRDGNRYSVLKNKKLNYISETITASTLSLYFTEPQHSQKLFSERIAEFYTIRKTAESTYDYTLSDNLHTTLHYVNGQLKEMDMRKSFVTVYLRLLRVE